jgi:hypothetical protein
MKKSDIFPSKYLKADDVQHDTIYTIREITSELVGQGEEQEEKRIAYFNECEKGLVLNVTNWDTIASLHGDDDDNWTGRPVTLFSTEVSFSGRQVMAIRVRLKAPKTGTAAVAPTAKPNGGKAGAWAAFSAKVKDFNKENPEDAYTAAKGQQVFRDFIAEVFPGKDPKTLTEGEWSIVAQKVDTDFIAAVGGTVPF